MLINGKWSKDFHPVQASDDEGRFLRQSSQFRNWITPDGSAGTTGTAGFAAETDRYHLYVALICPWASRTLMARKLKNLENIISVSVVEPFLGAQCWEFGDYLDSDHEPFYGYRYVHQLYTHAISDYTGQVTVPVLWDKKQQTIVNNESEDIIRMLNTGFGKLADNTLDLYPAFLQSEINNINDYLYDNFNNGVYQAGFATNQFAYEEAVEKVFKSLAYLEQRLQRRTYLVGEQITEADIRVFVTLIRFDIAYYGLFKTNLAQVRDYPNVLAYMKRLFAYPGISDTVDFNHIKQGYYSIKAINPQGIVPKGPDLGYLDIVRT